MTMKAIVLALLLVAVNAAPNQQGPSLDVLPGVIIHENESSDQDEVPVSPHLQPQPQISPPRATDMQADSKPMTLPAYQGQPIPDDALPTIMREERQVPGQNDVDGRLLTVTIGGRPNYASRLIGIVKAGDCPSSPPVSSLLLTCSRQECDSDDSCHGQRKCCRYQCATICANPVASYGYVDGSVIDFEGNSNNYQKPGSCYRPGYNGNPFIGGNGGSNYGRRKRQVTYGTAPLAAQPKFGYQQGGNGGSWGNNNGWGNGGSWGNNNGWGNGYQRCYNDRDCPGNQKCCNSSCRTPAFVG